MLEQDNSWYHLVAIKREREREREIGKGREREQKGICDKEGERKGGEGGG